MAREAARADNTNSPGEETQTAPGFRGRRAREQVFCAPTSSLRYVGHGAQMERNSIPDGKASI